MTPTSADGLVLVYITTPDKAEALRIGKALVEKRLAACVNAWEGMTSLYWWEGKIADSSEAVLIAKTTASRIGTITQVVRAFHSYSVPCVLSFPVSAGNPDYEKWLRENLGD